MLRYHIGNTIIIHTFFYTGNLVYCNDVDKHLQELKCSHDPKERCEFFLDLSKSSLKAAYYIMEIFSPSVSLAYSYEGNLL